MKKKTIKKRMIWAMIGISIIPIILLSIFTLTYLSRNLRREFITTQETQMSWAYQYADTIIEQIRDTFYTLRLNDTLLTAMSYNDTNEVQNKRYVIDTLNQVLYSNANIIDEIMIYEATNEHLGILNYRTGGTFYDLGIEYTIFSYLENQPEGVMFVTYADVPYVIHSINRFEDQEITGGIAFRLNELVINKFDEILASEESQSLLLNESMISLSDEALPSVDDYVHALKDDITPKNILSTTVDDELIWATTSSSRELTILKIVPASIISQALVPLQLITVGIGLLALTLSVFISIVISNRISQPLSNIVKNMQHAPLDQISVSSDFYDEISELERGYNDMSEAIKRLINEKYIKNLELKTAELKALQSQMNPHFLNNTFQLIGGMALSMNATPIYQVTSSMGEMMKYILKNDVDLLTLRDEIKHVNHYLSIQKQRFVNRFDSDIIVSDQNLDYYIPKFTLQPLIENSFKHGFKTIEARWKISLEIKVEDSIWITIRDNGKGLDEHELNKINEALHEGNPFLLDDNPSSTGIGLANIHQRIQLLFGKDYGLSLSSEEGGGLMVRVHIPKVEQGEAHV